MRRLLTTAVISVALCIPATAAIGFSGTAGAAKVNPTPTPGSSVVCTKMKYKSKTKKGVTTTKASGKINGIWIGGSEVIKGTIKSQK